MKQVKQVEIIHLFCETCGAKMEVREYCFPQKYDRQTGELKPRAVKATLWQCSSAPGDDLHDSEPYK